MLPVVLGPKQMVSTLRRGCDGTPFTSGIVISPDARFVNVANRLHDSIAWLSIGADGTLTWTGAEWTGQYTAVGSPARLVFD